MSKNTKQEERLDYLVEDKTFSGCDGMKRVFLGLLLFVMLFIVSACTGKDTDRETE